MIFLNKLKVYVIIKMYYNLNNSPEFQQTYVSI